MANKIGLFALRPPPKDFEKAANEIAHDIAPGDALVGEYGRKDYGEWGCFVIQGDDYGYAPDWCQALTTKTDGLGISVFVFEGNWDFNVFHAGRHVAGREAYTTPDPVLMGDLTEAARLLGVSPDLFMKYCVSPVAGLGKEQAEDEELIEELCTRHSGYRAFPGDEFEPWDEWGFCDFVKKLGFDYPDPGDRVGVSLKFDGAVSKRETWEGLPPRLGEGDIVFRATRPPGDAAQGSSKSKPWWKIW